MSEHGQVSRLLAAKFGSFLTFGAIRRGEESAPGQPLLEELRDRYRVPTQTASTKVMGVIGNPIGHSKSPALHNPCLEAAGVDACYVPFLVKDIKSFLKNPLFGREDFVGFSVTIPHKESGPCRTTLSMTPAWPLSRLCPYSLCGIFLFHPSARLLGKRIGRKLIPYGLK